MKRIWILVLLVIYRTAFCLLASSLDGQLVFQNRADGLVDARVTFPDGTGVGAGFAAQLLVGPVGTPVVDLQPLLPVTTFRTQPESAIGYVYPVNVSTPGVGPLEKAVVVMRAYNGLTWESSTIRGAAAPVTVTVGSIATHPFDLVGLQPFHVYGRVVLNLVLTNDHAQLTWPATNQQPYTVQASSSLASTNWVSLLTIVSTNGTATFTDPISITNSAPRFYRVVSP